MKSMQSQAAVLTRLRASRFTLMIGLAAWFFAFLSLDLLHNDVQHLFEKGAAHHLCYVCQSGHQPSQPKISHDAAALIRPVYAQATLTPGAEQNLKADHAGLALISRGPPA